MKIKYKKTPKLAGWAPYDWHINLKRQSMKKIGNATFHCAPFFQNRLQRVRIHWIVDFVNFILQVNLMAETEKHAWCKFKYEFWTYLTPLPVKSTERINFSPWGERWFSKSCPSSIILDLSYLKQLWWSYEIVPGADNKINDLFKLKQTSLTFKVVFAKSIISLICNFDSIMISSWRAIIRSILHYI